VLQVAFCEAVPPYCCIGARDIMGLLLASPKVIECLQAARRALCDGTRDAQHGQWTPDSALVALVHDTPMLEADCELRPVTSESPFQEFVHNGTFYENPVRMQEPRTQRCCVALSTETLEALSDVAGIRLAPFEYGFSRDTEQQWSVIFAGLNAMLPQLPDPASVRDALFPPVAFARSYVALAPGFGDYLSGGPSVPAYLEPLSLPQENLMGEAVAQVLPKKVPGRFGVGASQPCPLLDEAAMEESVAAFTLPQLDEPAS